MQTFCGAQRPCSCSPQIFEHKFCLARKGNGLPTLERPLAALRRGRRTKVTRAFIGAAEPLVSAGLGLTISSGLVSFLSFALGGIGLAYLLSDQAKQAGPNPECSTCEGTGLVPCICSRWSDGDRGCSICRNSGQMDCPSCGGGGKAVPIVVAILPTRQRDLMDNQRR